MLLPTTLRTLGSDYNTINICTAFSRAYRVLLLTDLPVADNSWQTGGTTNAYRVSTAL